MRAANLALKFLLELAAFASLALWGWRAGPASSRAVTAIALPAAAIVVWGLFAAPRSARRLPTRWRAPLELAILVLAAVALGRSGHAVLAGMFLLLIAANALLLTVFRQWES